MEFGEGGIDLEREQRQGQTKDHPGPRKETFLVSVTSPARTHERAKYFATRLGVHVKTFLTWFRAGRLKVSPLRPSKTTLLFPIDETLRAIEQMHGGDQ
jgi:hypothetical protein